jgi:hypothetical protein
MVEAYAALQHPQDHGRKRAESFAGDSTKLKVIHFFQVTSVTGS